MKKVLLGMLLSLPMSVFANEIMQFEGQCFVVDKDSKVEKCSMYVGNDDKNVMSVLKMATAVYYTENSLYCVVQPDCKSRLGTSESTLQSAKYYIRDGKTKQITTTAKENDWAVLNKLQENWMFVAEFNNPHIDRWKHTDSVSRWNNII